MADTPATTLWDSMRAYEAPVKGPSEGELVHAGDDELDLVLGALVPYVGAVLDNKAADRAVFDVWSGGELDRLDHLIAPDVIHHDAHDPHAAEGLAGLKTKITAYRRAFPDAEFTVEDQLAEGGKVLTRWHSVGTHLGSLMGEQPTGRRVRCTGMVLERFQGGRVVEAWRNWDALALLTGIDAVSWTRTVTR